MASESAALNTPHMNTTVHALVPPSGVTPTQSRRANRGVHGRSVGARLLHTVSRQQGVTGREGQSSPWSRDNRPVTRVAGELVVDIDDVEGLVAEVVAVLLHVLVAGQIALTTDT